LRAADQVAWLNRLQIEQENLRSALEWWHAAPHRGVDMLEAASAVWWFWMKRGHLTEGRQWLERALAGAPDAGPQLRVKALTGLWHMMYFRGDFVAADPVLAECLTLARATGDAGSTAFSLFGQALVAMERGDFGRTALLAAESEAAANASPDLWYQALPLFLLAYGAMNQGDFVRASELFDRQASVSRESGDQWLTCMNLGNHAMVRVLQCQYADARMLAVEGILLGQELEERVAIAWCLECLAAAATAETHFTRAVRLWGAIEGLHEAIGLLRSTTTAAWVRDRHLEVARESLDAGTFDVAWGEGRAMSLHQAIQYALTE
jgi:non-specific serine/threonine protein kinase